MHPNNCVEFTTDGLSDGLSQQVNRTFTFTFDNNSNERLRFYYWRHSGGKWKDHIDRDDDYFLESGESVTFKYRDRCENWGADWRIFFSVHIESNGGVRVFDVKIGMTKIRTHISGGSGDGFDATITYDDYETWNVDVKNVKKHRRRN